MTEMAVRRLTEVLQNLRASILDDAGRVCDGDLLAQFVERQDHAAFAALVQRHSAMVWGVCRRVVGHHHDSEDAFQATFLVLARKAACVRPRHMVANWLHGVALRTALKAKVMAAKRQVREKQISAMPEPAAAAQPSWAELEALIDQELAALPDKYRIALLLCDLEGKTGRVAARQLQIPEGTLAGRLRTARVLLARRLARHGLALSGGTLATMISEHAASACAPPALVSMTIKTATLLAAATTGTAGMVSVNVAALMKGVIQSMLLTKLKTVLAGFVVLGIAAAGGGVLSHQASAGQQFTATQRHSEAVPGPPSAAHGRAPAEVIEPKPKATGAGFVLLAGKKEGPASVTYAVADLVIPIQGLDVVPRSATKEDLLIKKIMRTVAPSSWQGSGGTGTIQYYPLGRALVVSNTPRVQAQVRYLLETMRRVQDVQVTTETRILRLGARSYLKVQELMPGLKKGHAVVNDAEAPAVVRKVQEVAGTQMLQAPKITLLPGQDGCVVIDPADVFGRTEIKLNALVAGNLQQMEFEMRATVGKAKFAKRLRLQDGATLALAERDGDDYTILLVTPRVIVNLEEEDAVPPPPAANPEGQINRRK
jgi:RNA polymerase sigma factor (sigma-70 family)